MRSSTVTTRERRAVQSFQSAAEAIGPVYPGMPGLFAVTRGQWSMIDAILHCLAAVEPDPVDMSLWTWTVAEYEVQVFERLMLDRRLRSALLVIDHGARGKNLPLLQRWVDRFGTDSIRMVVNHSKIATIQTERVRLLLRGSMNLNYNPRFEQFDLTEGGDDFALVKEIESEIEPMNLSCTGADAYKASKVSAAFDQQTLNLFQGVKRWQPK